MDIQIQVGDWTWSMYMFPVIIMSIDMLLKYQSYMHTSCVYVAQMGKWSTPCCGRVLVCLISIPIVFWAGTVV
jgi:hypothetical protein